METDDPGTSDGVSWQRSVSFAGDRIEVIDQTKLPQSWVTLALRSSDEVIDAIGRLCVRGAPAIGACGAFGLALAIVRGEVDAASPREEFITRLTAVAERIAAARPTAVNLSWAVGRVLDAVVDAAPEQRRVVALEVASAIADEDASACEAMARLGADRLGSARRVLTHCNTGRLATCGMGTALGVVYELMARGQLDEVLVGETRPLLQGARLSTTELVDADVPVRVMVDSAAAAAMALEMVDAVLVGADRIACNGDTANKIGTYALALAATAHAVPFYVVAPTSTFDGSVARGSDIVIEERPPAEVLQCGGREVAAIGARAWNPAFDVTPARLITAIITEAGVAEPPFESSLQSMMGTATFGVVHARTGR